jgi:hypothetical protein
MCSRSYISENPHRARPAKNRALWLFNGGILEIIARLHIKATILQPISYKVGSVSKLGSAKKASMSLASGVLGRIGVAVTKAPYTVPFLDVLS